MKTLSKTVLIAVVMLCSVVSSLAWLRRHFSDAEIVSRAELIVVGHIQDGSVMFIPHPKDEVGVRSWEHHVDLVISEVLKGTATSNSMVVSIHYGLQPEVSGFGSIQDSTWSYPTNYPKGAVEIIDSGNSDMGGWATPGDMRTNHIWLLRRVENRENHDTDWIGVYDPEDIQPISKKSELMTYLK